MKKFFIIIAVVFLIGIAMSSCNSHLCPAYAQADVEQIETSK